MDQKAFEIAVEKELEDVFGYHTTDISIYMCDMRYTEIKIKRKARLSKAGILLIIGFIFMAVLYFILETKFRIILVGVFELVILIGAVGFGLLVLLYIVRFGLQVLLYKVKKIRKEKKEKIEIQKLREIIMERWAKEEEIEKQRLFDTLRSLDIDIYNESVGKDLSEIREILKNYSIQKASKLLAKEDIRKRLCPALKSATDDVFDISKSITPVLVGCITAGTISIPLIPVLFAAIAVVIARMGISALCAGFITK